jgi:hypothetical protein
LANRTADAGLLLFASKVDPQITVFSLSTASKNELQRSRTQAGCVPSCGKLSNYRVRRHSGRREYSAPQIAGRGLSVRGIEDALKDESAACYCGGRRYRSWEHGWEDYQAFRQV